VENEPTCCTGNQVLLTTASGKELKPIPAAPWESEWIFNLANEFASGSRIHRATQGTHSCYLGVKGKVEFASEDIGRHNAMDKVIGRIMLEGIRRDECILYTTGRVPTDMVKKVVAAQIPVLVSKAVPTDAAVEMAKQYNLTLICKAWPDRYEIFHRGE
jgi:FdhD protein